MLTYFLVRKLFKLSEGIVAKIDELNAKVDELQSTLDSEQAAIQTAIQSLETQIAELQAQVGSGSGVTDEQLQAVIDKLETTRQDLAGTLPDSENPPEDSPPPPPVVDVGV